MNTKTAFIFLAFIAVNVIMSVSLSVSSSITHERFDISPNVVHIYNGSANK